MVQQPRDLGHSHTQDTLDTFFAPDVITFTDQAANPDAAGELQLNGTVLRFYNGTLAVPFGSVFQEAVSAAEATTATGSAADIKVISGLNIPVTDGGLLIASLRKSAGAAVACTIGLKVNATQVIANTAFTSAANQAESGFLWALTWQRGALYTAGGFGILGSVGLAPVFTAMSPIPNAAITSMTITGSSVDALVTLGVAGAVVYRLVGS